MNWQLLVHCMLNLPAEEIVDEIIEVDEYLKPKKGFGNFNLGKK